MLFWNCEILNKVIDLKLIPLFILASNSTILTQTRVSLTNNTKAFQLYRMVTTSKINKNFFKKIENFKKFKLTWKLN